MREASGPACAVFLGLDFSDSNFSGSAISSLIPRRGVHEDDALETSTGFSDLWRELMQREDLDVRLGNLLLQLLSRAPSKPVVGAQRIPVRDDENSRHVTGAQLYERATSSSTSPSGLISWI